MKIGYFIRTLAARDVTGRVIKFGGVKVFLQHVRLLNEMGYETALIAGKVAPDVNLAEELDFNGELIIAKTDELFDIKNFDLVVGTLFSDVKMLFEKKKGKVVHLCQGYEPIDILSRITGEVRTEKYLRRGLFSILRSYIDQLKFKRRIHEIESIYGLPTTKAAVSKHLVDLIEKRYSQKCFLIRNGIDSSIFYPGERRIWGEGGKIKILSVGSCHVGFKGIPDTLQAIRILKDKGIDVELIRVSPHPPSKQEKNASVVDKYYMNLKEEEMAELYRKTDIFVSSSLEGEGFGLPAIEALACGVPSILTEISSYINFDDDRDFACFVPVHRPDRIAEAIFTLIENRKLRERCVEKGRRVAEKFTLERTKQDLFNFVGRLI